MCEGLREKKNAIARRAHDFRIAHAGSTSYFEITGSPWGENELEEPLGSGPFFFGKRLLFCALFLLLGGTASATSQPKGAAKECAPLLLNAETLQDQIDRMIDEVTASSAEDTTKARTTLHKLRDQIKTRLLEICPESGNCSEQEVSEALVEIMHDVLNANPPKASFLRGALYSAPWVIGYLTATVWLSYYDNMLARAGSNLLTLVGAAAILKVGASLLEIPFAQLQRNSYSTGSDSAQERGTRQIRHGRLFKRGRGMVDELEDLGRGNERANLQQIATDEPIPYPWETRERFIHRSKFKMAKVLADLVPSYIEIDFSEPHYADAWRTLFSEWSLNDENREGFRDDVLTIIGKVYDKDMTATKREKYQRVIRAWTGPLFVAPPISEPHDTHQLQTGSPSHKEANPSPESPLEDLSLQFY